MTEREAELEGQVAVMRAALLRVEWGVVPLEACRSCPACLRHRTDGHTSTCALAAALAPSAGTHASRILTLVAEWERANAEHFACWQTPGYEREREEQLRERIRSAQGRLLEAARGSGTEGL